MSDIRHSPITSPRSAEHRRSAAKRSSNEDRPPWNPSSLRALRQLHRLVGPHRSDCSCSLRAVPSLVCAGQLCEGMMPCGRMRWQEARPSFPPRHHATGHWRRPRRAPTARLPTRRPQRDRCARRRASAHSHVLARCACRLAMAGTGARRRPSAPGNECAPWLACAACARMATSMRVTLRDVAVSCRAAPFSFGRWTQAGSLFVHRYR